MKKALRIATMATLALLCCCNSVWASTLESGIATAPEPAVMLLFGSGLLGLAAVSRNKFKS
jgi:hypothetical protein